MLLVDDRIAFARIELMFVLGNYVGIIGREEEHLLYGQLIVL